MRRKLIAFFAAIVVASLLAGARASAEIVRIAVGAASVACLPTWVAHEAGYFAREGTPAELIYIRGGPQTLSALVSGEVPFAQVYSGPIVAARLTGADTTIIAGLVNQPFFSVVTKPAIARPEDLRGK